MHSLLLLEKTIEQ